MIDIEWLVYHIAFGDGLYAHKNGDGMGMDFWVYYTDMDSCRFTGAGLLLGWGRWADGRVKWSSSI